MGEKCDGMRKKRQKLAHLRMQTLPLFFHTLEVWTTLIEHSKSFKFTLAKTCLALIKRVKIKSLSYYSKRQELLITMKIANCTLVLDKQFILANSFTDDWKKVDTLKNNSNQCCIFRPTFGCCTLQMLIKPSTSIWVRAH